MERCHDGVWGTVCSERGGTWTDTDANVVCRQLGFLEQDERGVYSNIMSTHMRTCTSHASCASMV